MKIFGSNSDSIILFNPRISKENTEIIQLNLEKQSLKDHFWLSTSGTTSQNSMKWVALSKEAIRKSAEAVNNHLTITSDDRWIHCLPNFHIGGLSIWARAELTNSEVIDYKEFNEKWDPIKFYDLCKESQSNFCSLVPTQVFDLINLNLKAPQHLKAIIVGGGMLTEMDYLKGRQLGWNLLPSYGMTECASQIATASLKSLNEYKYPQLEILSHIDEVKINEADYCKIKSQSLLTCYAYINERGCRIEDPKRDSFFQTEDKVQINGKYIKPLGRSADWIKIGGENVNLFELNHLLSTIKNGLNFTNDMLLIPYPDLRLGHVIHLVTTNYSSIDREIIIKEFNKKTLPYENIRNVHEIEEFPYTELRKVNIKKILSMIAS